MAFIPISNLLEMGGGRAPITPDGATIFVNWQDSTLHVTRNVERQMTVYVDTSGKKRVSINYSGWLPEDTLIGTSTFTVENNDSRLTIADSSDDGTTAQTYVTVQDGSRNMEFWLKHTCITDAVVPETISNSIKIACVRRVGS